MAQVKIAPHLLLEALFGGCADAEGLSLENVTFDSFGRFVTLDLQGPGLPAEGEVQAVITRERQTVKFLAVGGTAPNQSMTVGLDMASGPDMTVITAEDGSEWVEIGSPGNNGLVSKTARRFQRLEVKDTMTITGDGSGRALPELQIPGYGTQALAGYMGELMAGAQAAASVSQESTDQSMPITMVEPEETGGAIQAPAHVVGNLLKVR